jgi:colicin import membrane protein
MTVRTAPRAEFAPPPTRGLLRALLLAIAVHGLLLAVLAIGVQWKRDPLPVSVEAELWAALPEQAAPPVAPAPDPAPPLPEPAPVPAPEPPTPAPRPPAPDPNIAIEKEKARIKQEKQLEQQRLDKEQRLRDEQKARKLRDAKEKEAHEQELRDKLAKEKKAQNDLLKAQAAKSEAEAKKLAEMRKQQMDRMARLAGQAVGNGEPDSSGTAKQTAGPSASYGGRIRARVKPNITYTESLSTNPAAEVEVRTSPDGTIISRKLIKTSGVRSWDDAVLNAIDKTEVLPRDVDGRVPPVLTLVFRPKD